MIERLFSRWRGYLGCGLIWFGLDRITGAGWSGLVTLVMFAAGLELFVAQRLMDAAAKREKQS